MGTFPPPSVWGGREPELHGYLVNLNKIIKLKLDSARFLTAGLVRAFSTRTCPILNSWKPYTMETWLLYAACGNIPQMGVGARIPKQECSGCCFPKAQSSGPEQKALSQAAESFMPALTETYGPAPATLSVCFLWGNFTLRADSPCLAIPTMCCGRFTHEPVFLARQLRCPGLADSLTRQSRLSAPASVLSWLHPVPLSACSVCPSPAILPPLPEQDGPTPASQPSAPGASPA